MKKYLMSAAILFVFSAALLAIPDHFTITSPPFSSSIPDEWAGTPFTISITAYDASLNVDTSFSGEQVQLKSSNNYSDSQYTIFPCNSVTFTAGIAVMQVTMYKASTTWTGGGLNIEAKYGNVLSISNSFNLWWGNPAYIIMRAPGRVYMPGLTAPGLFIPDYNHGCTGTPIVQEAGMPFQLEVFYTDANYNRILTLPQTWCKLTSSDPLASIGSAPEMSMAVNNVYVTITAGAFSSNYMKLRTVGTFGYQTIYPAPASGSWTSTDSGNIPLRHTTADHFGLSAPSTPQTAGVPFYLTIQALDAFQNVCNNNNGGVAFNNTINLVASTGANTMYPYVYSVSNGQSVAYVRLFKAPEPAAVIQALYGPITGSSNVMTILPNEFKRLFVTDAAYGGMTIRNGEFTGTIPSGDSSFPMVTGAPFANDPLAANVSYQVGLNHFGKVHQFRVYAADAYGNITVTPELAGNTVTVTFNDAYGQPVTPATIDAIFGYDDIDLIFHTAKPGMYVSVQTTQPGIADYTTPTFTTYAGPAYGLQLLVPGLSVIEGSGRTTGAFSNWYNGVTGLASPQYTTSPFTVTVQAADIYGNFNYYAYNAFKVLTSATTYINPYPASFPTNSVNYYGYLGDYSPGRSTFTAMYDVSQARDVDLRPQDLTPAGPSSIERVWTVYPAVPIATSGSLEYQIIVKGVDYGSDGTNSVNAAVSPDTFALTVNVVDSISKKPVYGVNAAFRLVAVYAIDINTPTGVPLTVPLGGVGNVVNGVFTTIIEGYSMYDLIRIKVEDPNAVPLITTGPRYSCIIDFGTNPAPTPAPTFSMTDTPEITPTVTMTDTPEITPTVTMTDTAVQSPTNTETPTLTITVTTTPVTLTVPAQGLSYVFPQPANTTVNFVYFLTAQADITIRVYDISGVLKASVKSNGNAMALNVTSMNLSRLPSGFYLYTITGKTASNSNINFKTGRLVILKKIP